MEAALKTHQKEFNSPHLHYKKARNRIDKPASNLLMSINGKPIGLYRYNQ
ncbi:hypothetical protein Krac_8481 [Ktedonobacter racemifer DSM 44963]|uniref:Uncharacterized protein n=1 Tax=Ktedonobacter racemifer DSM 44963 TaxID=485913 RepID=D6TN04_KTERA|nr:hypothetical protein Krac_8481 [Ktedonobacter racemifer DSM 44963]